jgi:STE24 endopeptidase
MRFKTGSQHTFFAVVLILLAGLAADIVLWPHDDLPAIAPVDATDYFTTPFIARAQAFRGTQSWLGVMTLLTLVAVPCLAALFWPRRWAKIGGPTSKRRALACGVIGGGVAAVALLAALPFELIAFLRARDYGLAVQSTGGWIWDWILASLMTVAVVALLTLFAGALIRRLGRRWWPVFGVALIAFAVVVQALAPVVIAPLFADFKRLPPGEARSDVRALAERADVRAGEIYVVDAAKRTTGANAYVTGLGTTKRVVLYDSLLSDFTRRERRQVVAHEFGHAHYSDLSAGLLWFGFVAMVSMFAVDLIARALAERRGITIDMPAGIVMLAAAAMIAVAISQPAANAYSRRVEARADAFALETTSDPEAAIALERRLTVRNIARPEPPALLNWFFGTHPTPLQRIGMAVTVKREQPGVTTRPSD